MSADRTVGVVECKDGKIQPGYNLMCSGKETFLLDSDGRVVHEWRSTRNVFCAYLFHNGDLLRDGSENIEAVSFRAGGAAGYVERVTWNNELVWQFAMAPYSQFLSHHDLEILPNENVLVLCWERKTKEACIAAGRRPELIPDGEVWDNLVLEIQPNSPPAPAPTPHSDDEDERGSRDGSGEDEFGSASASVGAGEGGYFSLPPRAPPAAKGPKDTGARVVWQWSLWDHLVQDYDPKKENYGNVLAHHNRFDINFCPPGGKMAQRDATKLKEGNENKGTDGRPGGKTGEKDWVHCNSVAYCPRRDLIVMSYNVPSEIIIIHKSATPMLQQQQEEPGREADLKNNMGISKTRGILYRYGNPQIYRCGTRLERTLFCQHSTSFVESGKPGEGNLICFNNGRKPDRLWSTVDEYKLPYDPIYPLIPVEPTSASAGGSDDVDTARYLQLQQPPFLSGKDGTARTSAGQATPFVPPELIWSHGPKKDRLGSFYCTHISGCQRLGNGNTLITMGPQGIVFEVTPEGEEVWRYVSPAINYEGGVAFVRQGEQRTDGRFSLFRVLRYPSTHRAFAGKAQSMVPTRHLEA